MKETPVNSDFTKSKPQLFFEYALFALCLCVIALRATVSEGLDAQSAGKLTGFSDILSLSISTVLILAFVSWLVWSFCSGKFIYRFTGVEAGAGLFIIAAVVAGFAASNKRAAINNFSIMFAPVLMAVLLTQILDSRARIKLLLIVIAALGVVSAYQCAEQFFYWNEQDIEFYGQYQDAVLAQQNITPNTLQHWQFEHRLYSRDVKGFFATSNSAGSFLLLASFAAIALFVEKLKSMSFPRKRESILQLILCGIAVAVVLFGLAITRSRGAIIASLISAAMFITYLCFGNWLKARRRAILFVCLLFAVIGSGLIIWYGLTHGRLPGPNAMLVRWQYWHASARMYADHWLTGVGPGNFTNLYTHYKPAAALESVADPHNFLLSVLTQYGPLGLTGFLALIFIPLCRAFRLLPIDDLSLRAKRSNLNAKNRDCHGLLRRPRNDSRKSQIANRKSLLPIIFLIVISAALLVFRPILLPIPPVGSLEEKQAAEIILYIMPVAVFIIGALLLTVASHTIRTTSDERRATRPRTTDITAAALFCAVAGFLIHNLIDFAIFEPGVSTVLWAMIACLIAIDFQRKSRSPFILKPALSAKILIAAGGGVLIWVWLSYCLLPVATAGRKMKLAMRNVEHAHQLFAAAAKDDPLDPTALTLNGKLYLQRYNQTQPKKPALLAQAADCFGAAIQRDSANFKNYEKLSTTYSLLEQPQEAYRWQLEAAKRYPGSGRLYFGLAKIAEKLDKTDSAIEHYKKAIEIEDSYRRQFQLMYPGRELFSRLGEEKYQLAKRRVRKLSK